MTPPELDTRRKPTRELIAEAAAWVAVLHGANRTTASERGFREWLGKSAAHARAFEEVTQIWEESRTLRRPRTLHAAPRRPHFAWYAVAATAIAAFALVTLHYFRDTSIATGIGEQRLLVLEDGTRVTLNTDTRLLVSYDRDSRRIDLKEGEALFEVAKRPDWPFIVAAGSRQVRALGTTFLVRSDAHRLAVTLVEGKVAVSGAMLQPPTIATPGERITFIDSEPPKLDTLPVTKALAWQRREIALDDMSLGDAIAEVNRYNRVPVVTTLRNANDIRVTGLFRSGDSISFARAIARVYHLEVSEEPDRIVIRGEESAR